MWVVACAEGPNPEEWREFRARLISGGGLAGLKTTTEDDGGEVKDEDVRSETSVPAAQAVPGESVAPKNVQLLKAQVCTPQQHARPAQPACLNSTPSTARLTGPAHRVGLQNGKLWEEYMQGAWAHESPVEAGGLLLRSTLAGQLTFQMRNSPESDYWGNRLLERLKAELPSPAGDEVDGEEADRLFQQWSSNHM